MYTIISLIGIVGLYYLFIKAKAKKQNILCGIIALTMVLYAALFL